MQYLDDTLRGERRSGNDMRAGLINAESPRYPESNTVCCDNKSHLSEWVWQYGHSEAARGPHFRNPTTSAPRYLNFKTSTCIHY